MNLNSQQREEENLEVLLRLFITHMLTVCVGVQDIPHKVTSVCKMCAITVLKNYVAMFA